ncbi:MAG TPA: hypothetical protein VH375_07080 [Rhodanobacteraceae bacterium]|jgi:hypothetical protein
MSRRESPFTNFAFLVRDICQLRRGPEDMPHSPALLGILIAASVTLDCLVDAFLDRVSNVLGRSLVSAGLLLALCWIALYLRHLRNRYVQTATALFACGIVFTLLILPLAWLGGLSGRGAIELAPGLELLLGLAMLAVVIWNLAVNAHILRHALDAPFAFAFLLALIWAVADLALGHALFDSAG